MTVTKLVPLIRRQCVRWFHRDLVLRQVQKREPPKSALTKSTRTDLDTNVKSLGEKFKETAKTGSYLGVILVGVGVTGTLFYAVFRELFSGKSANSVYSRAADKCKNDVRVQDKLGLPITAHGFETRRGRRKHVEHVTYQREGKQCIRMKFYLKGAFQKGTVQLEMIENEQGKYEYRYLFIQVDDILNTTIVLEDNRSKFEFRSSPASALEVGF